METIDFKQILWRFFVFGIHALGQCIYMEIPANNTELSSTHLQAEQPQIQLRDNMCSETILCSPSGCCSQYGNCGFTPEHCSKEQGCKSGCDSKMSIGICSKSKPCSPPACCSEQGYCGFTPDHCGPGCKDNCVAKPPPMDCTASRPCPMVKACCSKFGSCGFGPKFCEGGCLRDCDAKPECGEFATPAGKRCPLNVCCSKFGFCGTTPNFCKPKECQSGCSSPGKPSCSSPPSQYRIGYYASWANERVCEARMPHDIDAKAYTHLNYAFGRISNGLMIEPTHKEKLLYKEFTRLKKSNPQLKVLISVGGWTFNDPGPTRHEFHDIVSSARSRSRFINSIMKFMKEHEFDGLDIDYEYPTAMDRGGFPTDTDDYLSLVQDLRSAFGSKYLLTIACPASYWYLKNFRIGEMSKYLDWINLMTYDFHGIWNKDSKEYGNVVRSHTDIQAIKDGLDLLFRDGVKPEKVALGLGTYGRSYTLENSACRNINKCRFAGPGQPGRCTREAGILALFEIKEIQKLKKIEPMYDAATESQVLSYEDQWISYDNEKTFNARIALARDYCLRGTMIWSTDMDLSLTRGEKVNTENKKWIECVNEQDCCDRKQTFCVGCEDGCFYNDVLEAPSFSDGENLQTRKQGLTFPEWMTELPDKLRLSEMSIPGTHDSGTSGISFFKAPKYTKTQTLSIHEQLIAGIRALDIRVRHIGNKFAIHHDFVYVNLNFDDVLMDVTRFLSEHPGEVVLMRIKQDYKPADNTRTFSETLQEYIDNYSKYFWRGVYIPKLGEARGKIVILDNTPNSPGTFGPFWSGKNVKIQDNYDFSGQRCCLAGVLQGCFKEETCATRNRIKYKWKIVREFFLETANGDERTAYVNFLSANHPPEAGPEAVASGGPTIKKGVNELAKEFLSPSNSLKLSRVGWVFMDFPGPSLIYSVLYHN